jgi:cobalt-zinc-cadmium resistance protein CzcA
MLPDLSIGYFSQTMIGAQEVDGITQNFGSGDRFQGVQAGITLPIVFGPSISKIKAARLKEQVATTEAEYYRRSLELSYRSMLEEYGKYSASVDYYEQQAVPEADLIISQSTLSYKAGAIDYIEYVAMLRRALEIRQNYLDALNNCNHSVISLDYITGKIY